MRRKRLINNLNRLFGRKVVDLDAWSDWDGRDVALDEVEVNGVWHDLAVHSDESGPALGVLDAETSLLGESLVVEDGEDDLLVLADQAEVVQDVSDAREQAEDWDVDTVDDALIEDDGQVTDADWHEVDQVVWDNWALEVEGVAQAGQDRLLLGVGADGSVVDLWDDQTGWESRLNSGTLGNSDSWSDWSDWGNDWWNHADAAQAHTPWTQTPSPWSTPAQTPSQTAETKAESAEA